MGEIKEIHEHHHHEHGEECTCGCHDHDHHHDHEHEHHHHDHEHNEAPKQGVTMSRHDDAIIGTVVINIKGDYESGVNTLKRCMNEVARWVEDEGGLVGHIKAFVREEVRSCMISVPEAGDVQIKEGGCRQICVENANIVFGVDIEKFEEKLKDLYKEYL